MIQRRTWKDISNSIGVGKELPNGEGVMKGDTVIIGTMPFRGLSYQFHGMTPDDVAEQAARWVQQHTGQDEVEPLLLVIGQQSFVLTKILTPGRATVLVTEPGTKLKVYR